jgi:hypothetical protein
MHDGVLCFNYDMRENYARSKIIPVCEKSNPYISIPHHSISCTVFQCPISLSTFPKAAI